MTKIEDIEMLIAKLSPGKLAEFRAFDAKHFDLKIENDAKAGRLDNLADAARVEYRLGRTRPL